MVDFIGFTKFFFYLGLRLGLGHEQERISTHFSGVVFPPPRKCPVLTPQFRKRTVREEGLSHRENPPKIKCTERRRIR